MSNRDDLTAQQRFAMASLRVNACLHALRAITNDDLDELFEDVVRAKFARSLLMASAELNAWQALESISNETEGAEK